MSSYVDANIQQTPFSLNTDPKQIGGAQPPSSFGVDQSFPTAARVYIAGEPYSDGLVKWSRPLQPTTGNLSLQYLLVADNNEGSVQARERDVKVSLDGYMYNFSSQLVDALGGDFQIAKADENWVSTGIKLASSLVPGQVYRCQLDYFIDLVKKTFSVLRFTVGTQVMVVPPALQEVPAAPINWAPGAFIQWQQGTSAKGGAFAEMVDEMNLVWS
jgi:hypothetical protein